MPVHPECAADADEEWETRRQQQAWLPNAIQETDSRAFRLQVASAARDLGATADTTDLVHSLERWKTDIKSGGRPVGLYVPRLAVERQLRSVAPDLVTYRDDQHPSGAAGFADAEDLLCREPALSSEWLALITAFGATFADRIQTSRRATRIRLFRGIRTAAAHRLVKMSAQDRFRWARRELTLGTIENWSPVPYVAHGALCDAPGVIIGAEFDTRAVVCTHAGGAEANVTPWRVDAGRAVQSFRYTSVDVAL